MTTRCTWAGDDPLYIAYHDEDWGVPVHDDTYWFEMLILEGAQAGLSWLTVLRKREHYRKVYDNWDVEKIAAYGDDKIAALLDDPGIIRNRLKVNASVKNARGFLKIQAEFGSFDTYIWRFVDGQPINNHWATLADVPAETDISKQLSKDLKKRGFTFVGPTICYALMQSCGMVNDHTTDCFRHAEVSEMYHK